MVYYTMHVWKWKKAFSKVVRWCIKFRKIHHWITTIHDPVESKNDAVASCKTCMAIPRLLLFQSRLSSAPAVLSFLEIGILTEWPDNWLGNFFDRLFSTWLVKKFWVKIAKNCLFEGGAKLLFHKSFFSFTLYVLYGHIFFKSALKSYFVAKSTF